MGISRHWQGLVLPAPHLGTGREKETAVTLARDVSESPAAAPRPQQTLLANVRRAGCAGLMEIARDLARGMPVVGAIRIFPVIRSLAAGQHEHRHYCNE